MANERLPDSLPRERVRAEIDDAARVTTERPDFPSDYVDRVEEQAASFALRTAAPDDIRAAIALLEEQTNVDANAPIDARNQAVGAAKKAVRKAVFFTVNHVTEQMRALGWATASVGRAAAERIEQLEARVTELEARVARLPGDDGPPES
jgi:BMFP domain-containing protein YqiC